MPSPSAASPDESLLVAAARRRSSDRLAAAEDEVRRLLEAGLALMREEPDGSPRIADIVRRAGASNDAFYRAFRGKDDLMAAIVDDGARRLVDYLRHQRDKESDPAAQVRAVVRGVLGQAGNREVADTTRAVMRNAVRAPRSAPNGSVQVRGRIADLLEPALGELGAPDPTRDALVASGAVFAVMERFLWEEREPGDADVGHLVEWITAAAGRAPG
jgi:AcrR family transcriptional regulator